MKSGIELIAEERQKQIETKCYTDSHDADHEKGELACAGAAYAVDYFITKNASLKNKSSELWPFEAEAFKPTQDDPIRQLVKAGALIAAEIDRLQLLKMGTLIASERKRKWRLIAWSWEDGEFTIELGSGEKKLCELPDGEDQTWLVDEFNRLVREDVFAPTDNPNDHEEMARTDKEHPWRDYSELPEWITEQL